MVVCGEYVVVDERWSLDTVRNGGQVGDGTTAESNSPPLPKSATWSWQSGKTESKIHHHHRSTLIAPSLRRRRKNPTLDDSIVFHTTSYTPFPPTLPPSTLIDKCPDQQLASQLGRLEPPSSVFSATPSTLTTNDETTPTSENLSVRHAAENRSRLSLQSMRCWSNH